jgi:regulator of extracellular matrix RemA (YlzA/DUF370 family)
LNDTVSNIKFINIGYGNMVAADKIVVIANPEPAPIKRVIHEAREAGRIVDATHGRKTRAVIFTTAEYIILSSLQPETITQRML